MLRFAAILTTAVLAAPVPALAQDADREITNIAGDVYLFRNNFHNSLVVPTPEGIVRVDPINAAAGAWLNDYFAEMGDTRVTHLIYSHSHLDHASGGDAHDGAEVIAHEDAPETIGGTEVTTRIGDSHELQVGEKTFELTNLGSGHDNHMVAVVVRPENVLFLVDVAAPDRLPYQDFGGANVDDWIGQIETALTLDFDHFAPGHGAVGDRSDLQENLEYMQTLRAGVLEGLEAGKSVEAITADLTLDAYADWGQYEAWRPMNIAGMARYLREAGLVK